MARGKYWRYVPHDDIFPPGSLELLIQALDKNPNAILAYGPTEMLNIKGETIGGRGKDRPHPKEVDWGWNMRLILKMYWKSYFSHAFKGLIRRDKVIAKNLFIRSTKEQILPERCWIFALCLLGHFEFVEESKYCKVFHDSSVMAKWNITGSHIRSNAQIMTGYLHDLVGPGATYVYGSRDIWFNAGRLARWMDCRIGPYPRYIPFPDKNRNRIANLSLPMTRN